MSENKEVIIGIPENQLQLKDELELNMELDYFDLSNFFKFEEDFMQVNEFHNSIDINSNNLNQRKNNLDVLYSNYIWQFKNVFQCIAQTQYKTKDFDYELEERFNFTQDQKTGRNTTKNTILAGLLGKISETSHSKNQTLIHSGNQINQSLINNANINFKQVIESEIGTFAIDQYGNLTIYNLHSYLQCYNLQDSNHPSYQKFTKQADMVQINEDLLNLMKLQNKFHSIDPEYDGQYDNQNTSPMYDFYELVDKKSVDSCKNQADKDKFVTLSQLETEQVNLHIFMTNKFKKDDFKTTFNNDNSINMVKFNSMHIKNDHILFCCSIQPLKSQNDVIPDKQTRKEQRFIMGMGFNNFGQLGHNDYKDKKFPFILPQIQEPNEDEKTKIFEDARSEVVASKFRRNALMGKLLKDNQNDQLEERLNTLKEKEKGKDQIRLKFQLVYFYQTISYVQSADYLTFVNLILDDTQTNEKDVVEESKIVSAACGNNKSLQLFLPVATTYPKLTSWKATDLQELWNQVDPSLTQIASIDTQTKKDAQFEERNKNIHNLMESNNNNANEEDNKFGGLILKMDDVHENLNNQFDTAFKIRNEDFQEYKFNAMNFEELQEKFLHDRLFQYQTTKSDVQVGFITAPSFWRSLDALTSDLKLKKDFMQDDIKQQNTEIIEKHEERDSLSNFQTFFSTFPLSYEEFQQEDDDHNIKKKKEQMFNDYRKINKDSLLKDQSQVEQGIQDLNVSINQLKTDINDNDMLRDSIRQYKELVQGYFENQMQFKFNNATYQSFSMEQMRKITNLMSVFRNELYIYKKKELLEKFKVNSNIRKLCNRKKLIKDEKLVIPNNLLKTGDNTQVFFDKITIREAQMRKQELFNYYNKYFELQEKQHTIYEEDPVNQECISLLNLTSKMFLDRENNIFPQMDSQISTKYGFQSRNIHNAQSDDQVKEIKSAFGDLQEGIDQETKFMIFLNLQKLIYGNDFDVKKIEFRRDKELYVDKFLKNEMDYLFEQFWYETKTKNQFKFV